MLEQSQNEKGIQKSKTKVNVTPMSKTLRELQNTRSLVLSLIHFEIIQRDMKELRGPRRLKSFING